MEYTENMPETRSRLIYALLGLFFGIFGLHNFYAGELVKGLLKLLLTLLCCCVPLSWLWSIGEVFLVSRNANGVPMEDSHKTIRLLLSLLFLLLLLWSIAGCIFLAVLPTGNAMESLPDRIRCQENLYRIHAALLKYAQTNGGALPSGNEKEPLAELVKSGYLTEQETQCPNGNIYFLFRGIRLDLSNKMPILLEKQGSNGHGSYLCLDGSTGFCEMERKSIDDLADMFEDITGEEEKLLRSNLRMLSAQQ